MQLPVLLREMTAADAKGVAEITPELGRAATPDEVAERFALRSNCADSVLYVAELEGWIVGFCQVQGLRLIASEPYAEVVALVVAGGFQRRGIGRSLLDKAHDWALAGGFRRLRLRAGPQRLESHRFCERLGFVKIKSSLVFERLVLGGIEPPDAA